MSLVTDAPPRSPRALRRPELRPAPKCRCRSHAMGFGASCAFHDGTLTVPSSRRARVRRVPRHARPRSREALRSFPRAAIASLRVFAVWVLLGVIGAVLVGLTVPTLFGYQHFVVMSGSMEPTLKVGDVVVDRMISPLDVRIGDIVTFKDPHDQDTLITHRVRSMRVDGALVRISTKGDAVNSVQNWFVSANGRIGRVVTRVPDIGYLVFWAGTHLGRLLLVAIPAALLGLLELVRIWRPSPRPRPRRIRREVLA